MIITHEKIKKIYFKTNPLEKLTIIHFLTKKKKQQVDI